MFKRKSKEQAKNSSSQVELSNNVSEFDLTDPVFFIKNDLSPDPKLFIDKICKDLELDVEIPPRNDTPNSKYIDDCIKLIDDLQEVEDQNLPDNHAHNIIVQNHNKKLKEAIFKIQSIEKTRVHKKFYEIFQLLEFRYSE